MSFISSSNFISAQMKHLSFSLVLYERLQWARQGHVHPSHIPFMFSILPTLLKGS